MKNIVKHSITATLILIAFVIWGCSNLFDLKPEGVPIEEDLKSSYDTQVFDLYAIMRGWGISSGLPALAIHSFRSEDAEKGSTSSDGADQETYFDNFEYTASGGFIRTYWNDNYNLIHKSNNLIHDVKNDPNAIKGDSVSVAEAKFFRAYAYFNLVRAFGEVPKIDFKLIEATDVNVPKSPAAEIYKLIDSDLEYAAKFLPDEWVAKFVGRITCGAAQALHARTYMMRNNWGQMYSYAMKVVDSEIYKLEPSYQKIFRENGENCSESILELQCTATKAMPGSNEIGSQFAQTQGVRGSGVWDLGWGWNTPTQLLADAFESGDPRKDETLLYFIRTGEDPNLIPANEPWGEKPIANGDVVAKYFNKKAYTDPKERDKFNRSGFWMNIRLIRYADVLLMAAEAANELGNTEDALKYLEMVRGRARGSRDILPKVTTEDKIELRNAIRHERRVELGMEFDRFYDLVRWGIAKEVLHDAGKTGYQNRHALLPIPQSEIDKSNGVLIQNPDY